MAAGGMIPESEEGRQAGRPPLIFRRGATYSEWIRVWDGVTAGLASERSERMTVMLQWELGHPDGQWVQVEIRREAGA